MIAVTIHHCSNYHLLNEAAQGQSHTGTHLCRPSLRFQPSSAMRRAEEELVKAEVTLCASILRVRKCCAWRLISLATAPSLLERDFDFWVLLTKRKAVFLLPSGPRFFMVVHGRETRWLLCLSCRGEVSGAVTWGQDRHTAGNRVRNDGERRPAQKFSAR